MPRSARGTAPRRACHHAYLESAMAPNCGRSVGRRKGFDAAAKFIRGMCASILRAFILSTAFAVFRGRERES